MSGKEERFELTELDFAMFKEQVESWLKELGLMDWQVIIEQIELEGNAAEAHWFIQGRTASIFLNTDLPEADKRLFDPDALALHEVLHLLFARIDYLAKERTVGPEEVEEEIHRLVRIIENVFYKELKECRKRKDQISRLKNVKTP